MGQQEIKPRTIYFCYLVLYFGKVVFICSDFGNPYKYESNKKNIIGFMYYLLFKFLFPKLSFRFSCQQAKKTIFFGFLWGICMDFVGNQQRMNFPNNRMWAAAMKAKKNPRLIPKKIHLPFDFRENSSSFDF